MAVMKSHRFARAAWVAGLIDVAFVTAFALAGRISHDRELTVLGIVSTLWTFLIGLATGWIATRAWQEPRAVFRSGVGIWLTTLVVAMFLRTLAGQGTAIAFIVVATIVTGLSLVGWRMVAARLARKLQPRKLQPRN